MSKVLIIRVIIGLMEKMFLYKMSQCFPKPYECFGENINVILDLSNCAIKNIKNSSNLAAKSDLAGLKTEVNKIVVDKVITNPLDLYKQSNVVELVLRKLCMIN